MRRIWVEPAEITGDIFELQGEPFHHAVQVIRLQKNEEFEVVSGQSEALIARITDIKKKAATIEVLGRRALPELKKPYIKLAIALTKWSTLETIVEKCVELGVASVQPLYTEFSFTRSAKDFPEQKIERIQKIIRAATEQCGRGRLMEFLPARTLKDFVQDFNRNPGQKGLFLYEGATSNDIQSTLKAQKNSITESVWAIVGSEGGFSEDEVTMLKAANLPPLTMGEQILRADTACFSIISVIKYELGLMVR